MNERVELDKDYNVIDLNKYNFHKAARYGNILAVRKFLATYGASRYRKINKLDKHGLTALHYAVRYGHIEVISVLVENGADVCAVGADGTQPIHFAARYFKSPKHSIFSTSNIIPPVEEITDFSAFGTKSTFPDVICYLLMNGAYINAVDDYNRTPLNCAALKGNTDALSILLEWPDVNIECSDTSGATPLHNACGQGHESAVETLLVAGASLLAWDIDHVTPLHYAASNKTSVLKAILSFVENNESVELTLKSIINEQDNQGQSCLHLVVDGNNYNGSWMLIEKGADVNLCMSGYVTPLHLAACTGNMQIIQLLVMSSANIEARNVYMEMPLHKAVSYNRIPAMEYLLKSGSSVDSFDKDNRTPLVIAAVNHNKEAAEVLLKYNANMCIFDAADKSAIFWAAEENAVDVITMLLDYANIFYRDENLIERKDHFDNTPLHVAAKKGYTHIVRILLNAGANVGAWNDEEFTPLHLAAIKGNIKVVCVLLTESPSIINDKDEGGNTALHLAALNGHHKLVNELIQQGATVDPRNSVMWTPLDCAAAKGHVKCVVCLLEKNSPIDPVDIASTTPLHLASKEGHIEVVELLVEYGADVTLTDHLGQNALDMAIENLHKDIALVFINNKHWLSMMQNWTKVDNSFTTPIRQLIKRFPDITHLVLNKCMKLDDSPFDSYDFHVEFFYNLVDDTFADWLHEIEVGDRIKSCVSEVSDEQLEMESYFEAKESHPLSIMCHYKCGALLTHPLVQSLINEKWRRSGRLVFYSKFSLYALFLFWLTAYILVTTPLQPKYSESLEKCFAIVTADSKAELSFVVFHVVGKYFVFVLTAVHLIMELVQLVLRRSEYVKDLTNWMEWLIYLLAIFYVLFDIESTEHLTRCPLTQTSVGCCSIFLAWINLLLFLQMFPSFGIYVVMFTDVLKTFARFSLTFALFIVAFAFGFYVLFTDKLSTFGDIGRAAMKTTVMMIGEFDYDNIFNSRNKPLVFTWLLFFIFVIIATLLLMNVTVGLAVDNIKSVLDQAVLTRVAMQVHLVLDVEKILPRNIRRKLFRQKKTVYPNMNDGWYNSLFSHVTSVEDIKQAIKPIKTISEIVEEHTKSIRESVRKLRANFKDLSKQTDHVERLLKGLIANSNIVEEDLDD